MRKIQKSAFNTALIIAMFSSSPSAQALHLSLVGSGTLSKLNTTPSSYTSNGVTITNTKDSSSVGLGGGALLGIGLGSAFEIESGLIYVTRKGSVTFSILSIAETLTVTTHGWQVPVLLRYNPLPFLSFGAGGYAFLGMGKVKNHTTGELTNNGTAKESEQTYSEADLKKNDFGLLFSAALRVPLSPFFSFLVDGRYALGMTDVNADPSDTTPALVQKYTDMQVLAGFRIGI